MSLSGRMIKCSCGGNAIVKPQKTRHSCKYYKSRETYGFFIKCEKCNKRTLPTITVEDANYFWNHNVCY